MVLPMKLPVAPHMRTLRRLLTKLHLNSQQTPCTRGFAHRPYRPTSLAPSIRVALDMSFPPAHMINAQPSLPINHHICFRRCQRYRSLYVGWGGFDEAIAGIIFFAGVNNLFPFCMHPPPCTSMVPSRSCRNKHAVIFHHYWMAETACWIVWLQVKEL